jgi:hypothetical protein
MPILKSLSEHKKANAKSVLFLLQNSQAATAFQN